MSDLDYLLDTYLFKEDWHETKLSADFAKRYFSNLIEAEQVVVLREEGEPIGYLSVWFLDKEQLAKLLNGETFHAFDEDITQGDFVFVSNAFLEHGKRNRGRINKLKSMMKDNHKERDYVGIIYQDGYHKERFSFYRKGEI